MSKHSEINIKVTLDDENVPEEIQWDATEKPKDSGNDARAFALGLWDHEQRNTLRIDLWTKEMEVPDMKIFYIDMIGGMSESLRNATGDHAMADMMQDFLQSLVDHVNSQKED